MTYEGIMPYHLHMPSYFQGHLLNIPRELYYLSDILFTTNN